MATSEQTPSPALLRLRPADVVRLCGLNAAAAGLDLVASRSVIASERDGNRLKATVTSEPPHTVEIEVPDEGDSAKWVCDCAHTGPLACEHVAAILSAWIAHPADFITKNTDASASAASASDSPLPPAQRSVPSAAPADSRKGEPSAETLTLAAALARMNAAEVDVIVRRVLGLESTEGVVDAQQEIVATLSDPMRLSALLTRLDSAAQMLLSLLDLAGGAITAADLEGLALRLAYSLSAVQSDIAVLERHALTVPVLPSSAPSQHGPGASWRHVAGWRIPDEVRRALSLSLPLDVLPPQSGGRFAPPNIEPHSVPLHVMRSAPRSLCLALALLSAAPPPLGLPRVAANREGATERHGAGLLAPGELATERLKELARGAGLEVSAVRLARRLLRQAREQTSELPADMERVPASERPVVLRAAFRRWLHADSAADLLDIESSGVQVRYAKMHPGFRPATIAREVSDARRFIARMLSRAQPEAWYSLESLLVLAWQVRPGLLRGQQQSWATPAWWLDSSREKRPLQPQIREDWMAAEGMFIRSLLAGVFATWGAVDLAAREDGVIVAFRLTPFGAFLFRRDNSPADSSLAAQCDADWGPPVLPLREGTLAVQPLAAEAALLDALALWATPTAVSGKRLVYSLSSDRACVAFDRHLPPTSLPALLRPLNSRAAEIVASRLNQWHAQWGQTRITTGYTLLEASDEATLLEALAAAPDIAPRCQRIGPALALVPPDDAEALRMLLARRGYAV